MPDYWVFPITEDNLNICLEHGIIGLNSNNEKRAKSIRYGDNIIFYVSRKFYNQFQPIIREFRGVAVCSGSTFKHSSRIWHGSEGDKFTTVLPIRALSDKRCKIEPLKENLSFIKNKKNWGSAFLAGVRRIPENDFDLIVKSME